MYYGGVGFQAIVPFEELQPEFLNGQCNGHHGPYLTPFHYITDFHVNFHIVHVDLQTGHVDLHNGYVAFAEWSCIDNKVSPPSQVRSGRLHQQVSKPVLAGY